MPSGSSKGSPGAKSAKALKKAANKKGSGAIGGKGLAAKRQIPWMTVGAVVLVLVLVGFLAYNMVPKFQDKLESDKYTPTETDKDPSTKIDGVKTKLYKAGLHIQPNQRVAYDESPPFGGPHDPVWATCLGNVYPKAIRTENAVHSLEHGAVWITYNPDKLDKDQIDTLKSHIKPSQFMLMSPYPGLDKPISLQSWGHQLKLDSPDDKRIDRFITALQQNKYTYPEVGAACASAAGTFDPDNPPPFDPTPPGPDAVPMDGHGLQPDQAEEQGTTPRANNLPSGAGPGQLPGIMPNMPGLPGAPNGSGGPMGVPPGAPAVPGAPAAPEAPAAPAAPGTP